MANSPAQDHFATTSSKFNRLFANLALDCTAHTGVDSREESSAFGSEVSTGGRRMQSDSYACAVSAEVDTEHLSAGWIIDGFDDAEEGEEQEQTWPYDSTSSTKQAASPGTALSSATTPLLTCEQHSWHSQPLSALTLTANAALHGAIAPPDASRRASASGSESSREMSLVELNGPRGVYEGGTEYALPFWLGRLYKDRFLTFDPDRCQLTRTSSVELPGGKMTEESRQFQYQYNSYDNTISIEGYRDPTSAAATLLDHVTTARSMRYDPLTDALVMTVRRPLDALAKQVHYSKIRSPPASQSPPAPSSAPLPSVSAAFWHGDGGAEAFERALRTELRVPSQLRVLSGGSAAASTGEGMAAASASDTDAGANVGWHRTGADLAAGADRDPLGVLAADASRRYSTPSAWV